MKTRILSIINWYTLAVLLVALVSSAVQVTPVYAASIVVSSNADIMANDGLCTLREALLAAQQNAPAGGCAGGSGADTITFLADYTITLGSQLAIASPVTIEGKGVEHTIIQSNTNPATATYRVFEVASQGNLTLENLTVRHGSCNGTCTSPSGSSPNGGAGIWNAGTLTVINSIIANNFAVIGGGIWNGGSLTVTNSALSRNEATSGGGGIWNVGSLTVSGSTFSDNSSPNGGGLRTSGGSAEIINSTFSNNSTQVNGGGIFNDQSSTITVTNSTFSGNSGPNGGGGIWNAATITLRNTIVADSPSGGNCAGTITNGGGNLDSGTTCGWGSAGGSLSNTNPYLDTLRANGGPTKTHALLLGSPAIAQGQSCPSTDQRGVRRPMGSFCDMGAYETYSIVVNSNADTIANDGLCTLREAITAANDNAATGGCPAGSATGTDSIRVAVNQPITLAGSQLPTITSPIIITGARPEKTIIQAHASPNTATHRVFEVGGILQGNGNLTLNQLTVRHGYCQDFCSGGAISNEGFLTIINSSISDNSAWNGGGGGIFNMGVLTVTNSVLSGNQATSDGGGIYIEGGLVTVTNSTISGNTSSRYGGGISNRAGNLIVTNSTISGNNAGSGGGIRNYDRATLTNSIVTQNTASSQINNCSSGLYANYIDGGHNLGDHSCGFTADNGSLVDSFDPMLGPLADNGGPTPTMALQSGSPAIDAADNVNCPNTDQRGGTRLQGSPCDIGAYEFGATIIVVLPPPSFADVPQSYWAWDFIERLYAAGITGGCASNPLMYCPGSVVTRDQMAVFLLKGKHGSGYVPPAATGMFADVPQNYWAAAWIEQLAREGITSGCATNPLKYCPGSAVTRDQMAVFLLKAKHGAGYVPPAPTGVFADVPTNYWAAAWIEQLAAEGVTAGCTANPLNYCPAATVTRDQMAVFLVKNFNLP